MTTEIKRYNIEYRDATYTDMFVRANGEYVRFSDHEAALREAQAELTETKKLLADYKAQYAVCHEKHLEVRNAALDEAAQFCKRAGSIYADEAVDGILALKESKP